MRLPLPFWHSQGYRLQVGAIDIKASRLTVCALRMLAPGTRNGTEDLSKTCQIVPESATFRDTFSSLFDNLDSYADADGLLREQAMDIER